MNDIHVEELEQQSRNGDFGIPEENKEFIQKIGGKVVEDVVVEDVPSETQLIERSENILEWKTEQEKKEKLALIRKTVARGVSELEFAMFIYQCKRTGLDPLSRQIYIIKRKVWNKETRQYEEVATIQTGIDGYRAIAERTHELAGISDAKFDVEDNEHPNKATISVFRLLPNNERAEFTATARWDEYAPLYEDKKTGEMKISGQWKKMPYLMLAKCAEALALRKAFPQDLSGIYTKEEMDQANKEEKND